MVEDLARALIVVNQKGFHSDEVSIPKRMLESSGHSVKIASTLRSNAVSSDAVSFSPDFAVYEVNPDYFEAVIVVGEGADELARKRDVVSLIRNMALKDKIVAGITMGPLVLAAAGVLSGRRATVQPGERAVKGLKECNARHDPAHVVVEGNILTGDDPESTEDLIKEMIKILG